MFFADNQDAMASILLSATGKENLTWQEKKVPAVFSGRKADVGRCASALREPDIAVRHEQKIAQRQRSS